MLSVCTRYTIPIIQVIILQLTIVAVDKLSTRVYARRGSEYVLISNLDMTMPSPLVPHILGF